VQIPAADAVARTPRALTTGHRARAFMVLVFAGQVALAVAVQVPAGCTGRTCRPLAIRHRARAIAAFLSSLGKLHWPSRLTSQQLRPGRPGGPAVASAPSSAFHTGTNFPLQPVRATTTPVRLFLQSIPVACRGTRTTAPTPTATSAIREKPRTRRVYHFPPSLRCQRAHVLVRFARIP